MVQTIIVCLLITLIVASLLGYLLYSQKYFTNGLNEAVINPKFKDLRHDVEFVFECEGVKYYKFTNELKFKMINIDLFLLEN